MFSYVVAIASYSARLDVIEHHRILMTTENALSNGNVMNTTKNWQFMKLKVATIAINDCNTTYLLL